MNTLDLTRQDIDQLIRKFRSNPNADDYNSISTWYESNIQYYPDQEYMVCIYLFLVGANIKHRYRELGYKEQMSLVKEIRDIIDRADTLNKAQRKVYLDFGTKAGI